MKFYIQPPFLVSLWERKRMGGNNEWSQNQDNLGNLQMRPKGEQRNWLRIAKTYFQERNPIDFSKLSRGVEPTFIGEIALSEAHRWHLSRIPHRKRQRIYKKYTPTDFFVCLYFKCQQKFFISLKYSQIHDNLFLIIHWLTCL